MGAKRGRWRQVVSVPLQIAIDRAKATLGVMLAGLAAIFLVVIILLNVLLSILIVRPVRQMSLVADQISTGDMSAPEIEPKRPR